MKERVNKIIYAAGIHSGGGLFILNYLKNKIISNKDLIYIDKRLNHNIFKNKSRLFYVNNDLFSKFYNECALIKYSALKYKEIIFLNGLPPVLRHFPKVTVYFQNANILMTNNKIMNFFSLNFLRFLKFYLFKGNVNKWIVFSKHAKKQLSKYVNTNKIYIKSIEIKIDNKLKFNKVYDYIYPASGEAHKNHKKLIEAFIFLSKKNYFPKLLITLNEKELKKYKVKYYIKKYNLKIYNKPDKNREAFLRNYKKSKALIFPSTSETLGLPLMEAKRFGLDILASNKNFAKEYTKKTMLFNPHNAESIVKVILKHLGP